MVELLKRALALRFRISTQLYLAIGGAVMLTIAASLVGWFSFNRVGEVQSRVNEGSVPELAAAFEVAQYSGTLVAAAPSLTTATDPRELAVSASNIDHTFLLFEEQVTVLEGSESAGQDRADVIRAHGDTLKSNIDDLKFSMAEVFQLAQQRQALQEELTSLRSRLDDLLSPAIDDQLFFVLTGHVTVDESPASRSVHLSEDQVTTYRRLSELQADTNIATELLANAFTLSDESFIEPLRERFEAAVERIDRNLQAQRALDFYDEASPIYTRLFELGTSEESIFNVFARELEIADLQAGTPRFQPGDLHRSH